MIPTNFVDIVSAKNLSCKQAAYLFGCDVKTLLRAAKPHGFLFRKHRRPAILAAISQGVDNSTALAEHLGLNRNLMSVTLNDMCGNGYIARRGYVISPSGRPCIRYRIIERDALR